VFIILTVLAWIASISLAVIPLSTPFDNIFIDGTLIEDSPFFSTKIINYSTAESFVKKMLTYDRKLVDASLSEYKEPNSWNHLRKIMDEHTNHPNYLKTEKMLG